MTEQWTVVWINFTPRHNALVCLASSVQKQEDSVQPNLPSLFFNSAHRHEAGMLIHASALRIITECSQWCNAGAGQATVPPSAHKKPIPGRNHTGRKKKSFCCTSTHSYVRSPLGTLFILDDKNHHDLEKVSAEGGHVAIKTSFKKLGIFCSQNRAAPDTSDTPVVFAPTPRIYSCVHLAFT